MPPYVWPILLLLLGLFFIVLELFIPSTGLLSLLAAVSIVAAVYLAFTYSTALGLIIVLLCAFVVPVFIVLAVKIWPRTPVGRKIVLRSSLEEDTSALPTEEFQRRQQLLGKIGVAKSKMLPSGVILIDGRAYDAVSRGPYVEPGQAVRVVSVSANRIVVAPVQNDTVGESGGTGDRQQSLSDFEVDPFREPLT